jgi:hypothetical protein
VACLAERGVGAGPDLGRLLDVICPPGASVLHGLLAPGWEVPLGHLVVAQRGVVVVGSRWAAQDAGSTAPVEGTGEDRWTGRSSAVKSALKGAKAMRSFLSGTPWAAKPVMAAVCVLSLPAAEAAFVDARSGCWPPASSPAVIVDDLWVGHAGRLPAWLASGEGLEADERGALRLFLSAELCAEHAERQAPWSLPERALPSPVSSPSGVPALARH